VEKIHNRAIARSESHDSETEEHGICGTYYSLLALEKNIVDLSSADFYFPTESHIPLFSIQVDLGYAVARKKILLNSVRIEFIAESISFCKKKKYIYATAGILY